MTSKYVLYFTGEEHALYRSAGRTLALEARFALDDTGISEFRDYLAQRSGTLLSVLADLAGEDFHEDQIPFLRGSEREAVVQRRLAQRFRDTRLAAALSLGYVTGERRNERLLLASFTNTQQLTPWLDAIEEAGAKLEGVYSVPLLAPALAAKLGVRAGPCLVVSAHRAGLRQCFIEDGRLRFARLERTVELAPQALAAFIRSETMRLAQYLVTLRSLPREGPPVQVLVIAPPGQRATFEQALLSDSRLSFHTVDLNEAARAAGVPRLPAESKGEALYLQLAAKKPPREQFASSEDRRRFFIWQLQRGVVAAGLAGLAACSLYAGANWLTALEVAEKAALERSQAQESAERYQRITAAFPVTQTTTDNLKAAVVQFTRIAERSPAPDQALAQVSAVLEQFPEIELDTLSWRVGQPEERAAVKPPAGQPAEGKPPASIEPALLLEVGGRINVAQRNDYREITAQVQRFADVFAAAGYERVRTQLPFDVTPEGTLTGDMADTSPGDAPRFTLVLARRLK